MDARTILEEVQAEERKRYEANGYKRLPPKEEAELRRWTITRCTEAMQLDPSFPDAYVERGAALYFEHRRAEAQADMRKAYSLRPKDAGLYHAMSFPFEANEKREILRAGMSLADPASLEYELLYGAFIWSYWYDGAFSEYVRLLEEWIPRLDPTESMYRHALQKLAQGYSALGQHEKAEAAYRRALSVSTGTERGHIAEMIIRTRMHRTEYTQARAALEQLGSDVPPDKSAVFNAVLAVLSHPGSTEAQTASNAALPIAEAMGRGPGPLGNSTSYYSFLLGLIYKGAGRHQAAIELLNRFAHESAGNKREWAITLRWEIATAREFGRTD